MSITSRRLATNPRTHNQIGRARERAPATQIPTDQGLAMTEHYAHGRPTGMGFPGDFQCVEQHSTPANPRAGGTVGGIWHP